MERNQGEEVGRRRQMPSFLVARQQIPKLRDVKVLLLLVFAMFFYVWYNHGRMVVYLSSTQDSKFQSPPASVLKKQNSPSRNERSSVLRNDTTPQLVTPSSSSSSMTNAATVMNNKTVAVARFVNGTLGYVADPTSLRQGVATFLSHQHCHRQQQEQLDTYHCCDSFNVTTLLNKHPTLYWNLLQDYENHTRDKTRFADEVLSPEYICALGPGRGYEQDFGYRLLSTKIQIHNRDNVDINTNETNNKSLSSSTRRQPKLLCLVYTHSGMRNLLRTAALSWGVKCDGFLAFSNETIVSLGIVDLRHEGNESYDNMWQKSRSIWTYVYQHYLDQYDFFHLGGDDLYVVVENMRKFLVEYMHRHGYGMNINNEKAIYVGQWIPLPSSGGGNGGDTIPKYYVAGGPGYTLNRVALSRLVQDALPFCRVHARASYEDRLVSQCFREINITGGDTRDVDTGEQLYHGVGPAQLYTFESTAAKHRRGTFQARAASFWETLPFPTSNDSTRVERGRSTVGPKHQLDAAGTYSTTLHDIYHPQYMARLHSILYGACPMTTPLGRALGAQCSWT